MPTGCRHGGGGALEGQAHCRAHARALAGGIRTAAQEAGSGAQGAGTGLGDCYAVITAKTHNQHSLVQ